jgi:hypothetical protein
MRSHSKIGAMIALLALLLGVLPESAQAGSLLSGYGGSGEGSQAILGSALVNGPPRGGPPSARGGSRGGSASPGVSPAGPSLVGVQSTHGGAASTGSITRGGVPAAGGQSTPAARGAPRTVTGRAPTTSTPAAGRRVRGAVAGNGGMRGPSNGALSEYSASDRGTASQASVILGLSGEESLYALLALGVLAFIGVLTGRLTRGSQRRGEEASMGG